MTREEWLKIIEANNGNERMEGNASELIMCAFALGRWAEVPKALRSDPWAAWNRRLTAAQREAVQEWRATSWE
ncbi:MAG: hypothetical protein RBR18_15505 [Desulfovibrionaceae bacterium]|nr:hypothetical protein [Desulfovibrionaceae bacterium]